MNMRQAVLSALRRGLRGAGAFSALLLLAGCQLVPDGEISVGSIPTPSELSREDAIGAREHPRVVASYGGVYKDAKAEKAIARVVGRLVAASDDPSQSYRITILNSPTVNAFALPGGYLYITRGLLALANDSSEVAAVLAHEMGHVTARHAIARQQRAEATALVNRVVTSVVEDPSAAKNAVKSSQISLARFSQQQELDADAIGVRTLAKAGYDPYASARFLDSMGRYAAFITAGGQTGGPEDFLATHPSTPERVVLARQAARQQGAPGIGERDRNAYLKNLSGMLYGDDPLEGFVRGRSFLHKALGIGFTVPRGYVLENSPEAVMASNADGAALRFDGADLGRDQSLEDYVSSGWINGLVKDSLRKITVNGLPAVTASAIADGWSFRIAIIRVGKSGFRFIAATREPSAGFTEAFEETVKSFRQLTPTEQARLNPLRIRLVKAGAGDTPAVLARKMTGIEASRRLELFAILNGIKTTDRIPSGTLLKVVVE